MVRTDFARRGVPWVALLLRSGHLRSTAATTLNLGWRHRASAAACATGVAGLAGRRPPPCLAALLVLLAANREFYGLLARRRGLGEAVVGVGLHVDAPPDGAGGGPGRGGRAPARPPCP